MDLTIKSSTNMSPILHKRRARAWLDENIGDHWGRSDVDGHYFAIVPGRDEMVTADTIEELADECRRIVEG